MTQSAAPLRLLVPALALLLAPAALAQDATGVDAAGYRTGLPAVMAPATAADAAATSAAFAPAYAKAGRPRVVVYWMRSLGDRVAPTTYSATHSRGSVAVGGAAVTRSGAVVAGGYGGAVAAGSSTTTAGMVGHGSRTTVTVEGEVVEGDRDWLPARESTAAESAFAATLINAGARVVDRTAITRLLGGAATSQTAAEATALAGAADLLIEITALPDPDSDSGRLFRIDAIATRDGRLLATLTTDAEIDMADAVSLVPRQGGGYREVLRGDPLGRGLAVRTMQALTRTWGG